MFVKILEKPFKKFLKGLLIDGRGLTGQKEEANNLFPVMAAKQHADKLTTSAAAMSHSRSLNADTLQE